MKKICIPNMKVKDFVADLYVEHLIDEYNCNGFSDFSHITLIETNPYGLSDTCLFKDYDDLENTTDGFRHSFVEK